MTCKRNGAVTVAWRLLVRYSVRLQRRLNSDRRQEFWDFLGSRRTVMGTRLLCYSLSRTTTPAVWVSVLVVGKEAYARHAEDEQLTFLWRLVDISDGGTTTTSPRPGDASPTTTWAGCILLACQWPKIVQPRTGWRHARQQPDFLLLFGTCGDSLSGTTTGDGAAEWIKTIVLSSPFSSTSDRRTALKLGTTDLRGLRNTLVQKKLEIYLRQKSRFWSVHACLKLFAWRCKRESVKKRTVSTREEYISTNTCRRGNQKNGG